MTNYCFCLSRVRVTMKAKSFFVLIFSSSLRYNRWYFYLYFGEIFLWTKICNRLNPVKKMKEYITEKKFFENLLVQYPFFFFLVVKITPYISTPSLFSVGMKKYHFWKYLFYSVLISCIVKAVYISLWYLWWISLARLKLIQEWRSELALFLIIWVVLFYLMKLFLKKFSKKLIARIKKYVKKVVH